VQCSCHALMISLVIGFSIALNSAVIICFRLSSFAMGIFLVYPMTVRRSSEWEFAAPTGPEAAAFFHELLSPHRLDTA
jgi:hypothetical protein